MKQAMNWIKYSILFIGVAIVAVILVVMTEIVLTTQIGLGQPVVYDAHLLWGYAPRAARRYERFDDNIVTINDVGLRSSLNWRHIKNNKILFLGDSVTYGGSYVDDKETFPYLVCQALSGWYCFNGGVNSYGILNMVARSRYDKRIQDASVVVFTFITGDFNRGLQKSNRAHFILRNPPDKFPATWEVLNFIATMITPKNWFGKINDAVLTPKAINEQKRASRNFALDILYEEIRRLHNEGKPVLLVYSPSVQELNNPTLRDNELLMSMRHEFPDNFFSMYEAFLEAKKSKAGSLYRDTVHYEYAGHQLAAKLIAQRLKPMLDDFESK